MTIEAFTELDEIHILLLMINHEILILLGRLARKVFQSVSPIGTFLAQWTHIITTTTCLWQRERSDFHITLTAEHRLR